MHHLTAWLRRALPIIVIAAFAAGCAENTTTAPGANETNGSGTVLALAGPNTASATVAGYLIELEKVDNGNGTWTWTWKFTKQGAITNLSHFDISLGQCLLLQDIVAAYTSPDGVTFNSFTPTLRVDPSQDCSTSPMLKFDLSGANVWFRIVISVDYEIADVPAVLKGGNNFSGTGSKCVLALVPGVGCPAGGGDDEIEYQCETAWSSGTRFVNKGSWATYSVIASPFSGAQVFTLFAGQTMNAGTLTVAPSLTPGHIDVTFTATGDWMLTGLHLHVAQTLAGIPRTSTGNPVPGQFAYQYPPANLQPWSASTHTLTIPWTGTAPFIVAAHANVCRPI